MPTPHPGTLDEATTPVDHETPRTRPRAPDAAPAPPASAPRAIRPPTTFLDPADPVQVKYEMLRLHRVEGWSVTAVAARFGVSRQTFYKLERAFEARGMLGLVPLKSGPRGGWKCTPELLDFLRRRKGEEPTLEIASLRDEVEERFQVKLHPNTVRYALAKSGRGGERAA